MRGKKTEKKQTANQGAKQMFALSEQRRDGGRHTKFLLRFPDKFCSCKCVREGFAVQTLHSRKVRRP
jgi:hypothetical protein